MKLLNEKQIHQRVNRLAIEILENNYMAETLYLAGINNKGYEFGRLIKNSIKRKRKEINVKLCRLTLNPADPLGTEVELSLDVNELSGKTIIIIDDVANTGRTLFYACKPLLSILPEKVEVAVLVDRKHKRFPVRVDYTGISLATTLKDNIEVKFRDVKEKQVLLE